MRKCDICGHEIVGNYVDGKTIFGPWATMHKRCHAQVGVGLGTGRGQEYTEDSMKVAG